MGVGVGGGDEFKAFGGQGNKGASFLCSGNFEFLSSTSPAFWTSLVAQTVKCLLTMRETWVRYLGQEDPLEKAMATHSSTLAWKIPWTEEPGRLQSMGSQRVRHDWATSLSLSPAFYVLVVMHSYSIHHKLLFVVDLVWPTPLSFVLFSVHIAYMHCCCCSVA